MQKELRAKSAVHRRQAYHQQLMDKRHSLLGHRHCDGGKGLVLNKGHCLLCDREVHSFVNS